MKKITPYKHQLEAFNFIKDKDHFALFMDMGTGKSFVILMKLSYLIEHNEIDKCIIIVPNYLKDGWITDVFETYFDKEYISYVYNNSGFNTIKEKAMYKKFCESKTFKVLIVNVELFQTNNADKIMKQFLNDRRAMIVIDESIIIKNPKAQRTIKVINGYKQFKYKAILSGTPTPNSPADLYSQFDFLKQFYFNCNYFQFKHKHTIFITHKTQNNVRYDSILTEKDYVIIKNALSKQPIVTAELINELSIKYNISESNLIRINKMNVYTPYKDLDKLNEQISQITFKVMKKDCLDLPDKIYEKLIVELTTDQKRLYKELTENFFTSYKDNQLNVTNTLGLIIRLKMITGGLFPCFDTANIDFDNLENFEYSQIKVMKRITDNPKINAIIEDIGNTSEDTSIIIWSNFIEGIKYLRDEIKKHFTCETYFGETKNRQEIIEGFKSKQFRILIANPMTAGMGLNLQVSTLHYFFDNSYRADLRTQAEDRSHRAGQTNKVVYKDVIAKNTIDEKIYQLIINKIDLINYFKDKDKNNLLKEVILKGK